MKEKFMSKRIALVLILLMLVNMTAWSQETDFLESPGFIAIVLACVLIPLLIGGIIMMSEADAPDDGIRLVSQTVNSVPKTKFGSFLNFLQRIEFGQTYDNKFYTGLRFQF
jgi:hypothetical protein